MESPEDIEKALAALVPSAISEKGQRSLDELIDNLAAGNAPLVGMEMPASRRLPWGWIGGLGVGAAAVLAVAFQIPAGPRVGAKGPVLGHSSPTVIEDEAAVVSLGRPELIEAVVPEVAESGIPPRQARVRYVQQERLLDRKSGCEVVVTSRPSLPDTAPLGIAMGDLPEGMRAHLPDLPHGLGFMVTAVDANSAYGKAGMRSYDILWKIGDQFIANKSQFVTLLQLHEEGEEVKFSLYRSGKALEIPVVLGAFPEELREPALAMAPAEATDGVKDFPMKVLRPERAETENPEGKVTLWQTGGVSEVKIVSHSGAVIYEGLLVDNEGKSLVPASWQIPVSALERGYVHQMQRNSVPPRLRRAIAGQDTGDK